MGSCATIRFFAVRQCFNIRSAQHANRGWIVDWPLRAIPLHPARWYLSQAVWWSPAPPKRRCTTTTTYPASVPTLIPPDTMNPTPYARSAIALSVLGLLSACGGGGSSTDSAQSFVAQVSPEAPTSNRLRALGTGSGSTGAAAVTITNEQLFQWAQKQYPEIFGTLAPVVISNLAYEGKLFDVRDYRNGSYLGVANGVAYGLGPFTGNALQSFGAVQGFADTVCPGGVCPGTTPGGGGGGGPLNGCTIPASQALQTGNSYRAVYVNSQFSPTASSGEYTLEGVVNGPATFQGQSAIQTTNTVSGFQLGEMVNTNVKTFQQVGDNELLKTLGTEFDSSFSGFNISVRTVTAPAWLNSEYTLSIGQSITKTETSTQTYISSPIPLPPQTSTTTSTHKYEARETISVQGRSWDTCRYRVTTAGSDTADLLWVIYGKGFMARQEAYNGAGTLLNRSELKTATMNGSSL
jgi:hypothetical protein